jgi:hypothetical protein
MTIEEYIKAAVRTESHPNKFLNNLVSPGLFGDTETKFKCRLLHGAIGLCTEVGELAEYFLEGKPEENLKEELGDLLWYCAIIWDATDTVPFIPDGETSCIETLTSAIGNVQDVIKRSLFYGKDLDLDRLLDNVSRVYDYCLCTLDSFGLEETMEANIAKLKVRYPEKFTEECALNRNLEKEMEALSPTKEEFIESGE